MSFPPGTEMFQFSGFASPKPILFSLVIPFPFNPDRRYRRARINGEGGFPHSEIVGSKLAHSSPTLIAACHVLHRLCMPRHPRIALTSRLRAHTTNDKAGPFSRPAQPPLGAGNLLSIAIDVTDRTSPTRTPPLGRILSVCETHAVTASISKTHSQCQRGAQCPAYRSRTSGSRSLHLWKIRRGMVEPIGIEPMT